MKLTTEQALDLIEIVQESNQVAADELKSLIENVDSSRNPTTLSIEIIPTPDSEADSETDGD